MLSVLPEQSVSMERQEIDLNPSTSEVEEIGLKQVEKKQFFTKTKIFILIVLIIAGFGAYQVFDFQKEVDVKNGIN